MAPKRKALTEEEKEDRRKAKEVRGTGQACVFRVYRNGLRDANGDWKNAEERKVHDAIVEANRLDPHYWAPLTPAVYVKPETVALGKDRYKYRCKKVMGPENVETHAWVVISRERACRDAGRKNCIAKYKKQVVKRKGGIPAANDKARADNKIATVAQSRVLKRVRDEGKVPSELVAQWRADAPRVPRIMQRPSIADVGPKPVLGSSVAAFDKVQKKGLAARVRALKAATPAKRKAAPKRTKPPVTRSSDLGNA